MKNKENNNVDIFSWLHNKDYFNLSVGRIKKNVH